MRWLTAILRFVGIVSRGKPTPPAPKPTATVTVCLVGGLGKSQLTHVGSKIAERFPFLNLVSFGDDAYRADIAAYILSNNTGPIILLGHSMGADACAKAAATLMQASRVVTLMILYDAVAINGKDITIPPNVVKCISFTAGIPTPFITQAQLHGVYRERVVSWTGHNGVPSDRGVVDGTLYAIAGAMV